MAASPTSAGRPTPGRSAHGEAGSGVAAVEISPSPDHPQGRRRHRGGSGPAPAVTLAGTASAHLTGARPGDYFDNGSIQHLSHVIQDLEAFYARQGEADSDEDETYLERVQRQRAEIAVHRVRAHG
jgi:hypothetical protein